MKSLWVLLLVISIYSCSGRYESSEEVVPSKPNIVFIFADDQTYTAVHALGNSEIETPNLDRLVNNGITFTHTYNMGGGMVRFVSLPGLCSYPAVRCGGPVNWRKVGQMAIPLIKSGVN